MFFSLRRNNDDDDDDSPIEKGKPLSFSGVVRKLNETSPSPKKGVPNGTGLLSVVTALAAIDPTAKDAHLSSDELVKKLFKGLGMPMYKPEVQPAYLKKEVPSAVQDYRWGAFDLPVYHDTMLSIVRPPTPPPVPEQTQLLLDTVPFNEAAAPANPPDKTEATAAVDEIKPMTTSIHGVIESISSRGSFSAKISKESFVPEFAFGKYTSSGLSAKQSAPTDGRLKSQQSASAEVIAAGMAAIAEEATEGEERSELVSPASASERIVSPGAANQGSTEGPAEEAVMEAVGNELEGLTLTLALGAGSSAKELTQPRQASRAVISQKVSQNASQKRSDSEAFVDDSEDVSVEALLQLGTIESQRQYLKPEPALQQEVHKETTPTAADDERAEDTGKERVQEERDIPPVAVPAPGPASEPEPRQSPRPSSTGQSAARIKSPPMPIPAQPSPLSPPPPTEQQAKTKAEGKIVSPASRSVFKPTFAMPRPPAQEADAVAGAEAVVDDGGGGWESGMLSFSPPKAKQGHVFFSEHQSYSAQASPQRQHQHQHQHPMPLQGQGEEESGSPSHHDHDHDNRRRKKHASPGRRWYLAGAYSSHTEAVDAIHKMDRAIDLHGVAGGGEEGDGSEGRFRIQRDLGRMQWVVECNDLSNKPLVLSHGNRGAGSGSDREADKYRRIVQSVGALHQKDWDMSPDQQRPAGSKLQVQARREGRREGKEHREKEKPKGRDKYLRERDAHYENNLRQIRQRLPREEEEAGGQRGQPRRPQGNDGAGAGVERGAGGGGGGVRFPPIQQARNGADAGRADKVGAGSQPHASKGNKGKKKG